MKLKLLGTPENLVVEKTRVPNTTDSVPSTLLHDVWERINYEHIDFNVMYLYYESIVVRSKVHFCNYSLLVLIEGYDYQERIRFAFDCKLDAPYWRFNTTEHEDRFLLQYSEKGYTIFDWSNRSYLIDFYRYHMNRTRVLMLPMCLDLLRMVAGYLITS